MLPAFAGRIPVCMRCQERDIRQQSIGDGLWPGGGEGIAWVCDTCGHIGAPLLLDPEGSETAGAAWEGEYEDAAARVDADRYMDRETRERTGRARGLRILGIVFLVVAAIFLLPPAVLLTGTVREAHWFALPGALAYVLGQTWLFIGVGTVLLVMARRKIDEAAGIEASASEPLTPSE